ncbi:SGNH/GDSL hydrolase family protein [Lunatibacter salilacus]|uniref:SGNH/GDSL hydrolase family protein n=1 Tax=Lunatibacter salilacus TaxID=2483804 RepID=UPI00131CB542|nr:SGNH/GDSL hydrolase family protein [Lunatibacter salilacus]
MSKFKIPAVIVLLVGLLSAQIQLSLPSVFVIGDSISIQYGPYLEQYLQGVFEYDRKRDDGQSSANLDNPAGANGGDSGMVLDYVKIKLEDPNFKPDVLVLNCGLHDIKTPIGTTEKQVSLDTYKSNLVEIFDLLTSRGIKLVWVRTTPVDDEQHNSRQQSFHRFAADLEAYNEAADAIFRSREVPIIDLYQFTKNLGEDIFIDHVHYGEEVRAKQAAFIAGFLAHFK